MDKGGDSVLLNTDNYRFINHSKNPNVKFKEKSSFALRDIKKGEELSVNYEEIDIHGVNFEVADE